MDWMVVIETLRAKFHQVKLPKSFLAINLSESHTFHRREEGGGEGGKEAGMGSSLDVREGEGEETRAVGEGGEESGEVVAGEGTAKKEGGEGDEEATKKEGEPATATKVLL